MNPTLATAARLRDHVRDPMLSLLALVLAFILFVHLPLAAQDVFDPPVLNAAIGLVIAVSVVVVSRNPVAVGLILLAGAAGLGTKAAAFHTLSSAEIVNGATLVFLLALSWVIADAVFAPGRITVHRIVGAVVLYLNIGAIFLTAYVLIALRDFHPFLGVPSAEHRAALRADLCYFSFSTLTSLGYGDIVPIHPIARGLANVEAIIGQMFPATLLARLVTLELAFRRRRPRIEAPIAARPASPARAKAAGAEWSN